MNLKLSTIVQVEKPLKTFNIDSVIAGVGSCFAQYVMEELGRLGFKIASNPNGIVYNSHSILQSLRYLDKDYPEATFFEYNGLWHSWEHHGSFFSKTKEELQNKINAFKKEFLDTLRKTDLFIMTPSSSVVYSLKESGMITANCHKYPNNNFSVELLSKEENLNNLKESISLIRSYNSNCYIVVTLSPVRHYPGDLCLNSRSKANLLSAIRECADWAENCIYFPSYEILMDELRDYRFYADDMMHPSELARKIILDRFISAYFTENTQKEIAGAQKQLKFISHRSFAFLL